MLARLHALRLGGRRRAYAEASARTLPVAAPEVALAMMTGGTGGSAHVGQYLRTVAENKDTKKGDLRGVPELEESTLVELVSRWHREVIDCYMGQV